MLEENNYDEFKYVFTDSDKGLLFHSKQIIVIWYIVWSINIDEGTIGPIKDILAL